MKSKPAFLYWIHLPEHSDPLTQGYIGVSTDPHDRWKNHLNNIIGNLHPNPHLSHAVKKYGWENLIKEIIFTDDEKKCYLKEQEYRPQSNIGWNISSGGRRGPGRTKGAKIRQESIEKMLESRRLRKIRIESGNLTDDDIDFMEKKKEKALISAQKKEAVVKARIKAKQDRIKKKEEEKERIKKEKNQRRTQGVKLTNQPNRPFCKNCKTSLAKPNGVSVAGFQKWHKYCTDCAKAAYNPKFGYLVDKKIYCEDCGFIAKDKCQLDVVYKDANRKNKSTNNIKTVCANCYRLLKKLQKQSKKSILDITVDTDATI